MTYKSKCNKCEKAATVKFTRIEDGNIYDIYLCAEHAAEMSPYQKQPKIQLSNILEGLLKQELGAAQTPSLSPAALTARCATCGTSFQAYKKNLMLGCSDCYHSFREYLIPDLRRFHGEVRHTGRCPGGGTAEPVAPSFVASELIDEAAGLVPPETATKGAEALLKDTDAALAELQRAMRQATEDEDYERAARLRDQIREIRQQQGK